MMDDERPIKFQSEHGSQVVWGGEKNPQAVFSNFILGLVCKDKFPSLSCDCNRGTTTFLCNRKQGLEKNISLS